MARSIDHLVLAAKDLEAITAAYRRLGFLVGGRNRHPWGTENRIVQLEGTFLELISLGAGFTPPGAQSDAAPFASTLARYLERREGLAMVALGSSDAAMDAQRFAASGIGLGKTLHFSRSAESPDGKRRDVAFTIAFALDPAAPKAGFFVCQHHRPENFWNASMQRHPNTAHCLLGLAIVADRPAEQAGFLTQLFGQGTVSESEATFLVQAGPHVLEVMSREGIRSDYGEAAADAADAEGVAVYRVGVGSLEAVRRFLNVMGSPYERRLDRLIVPPGVAGGVTLSFEPSP